MKVLWITNILFSHHYTLLGKDVPAASSGSWLYAAYEGAKVDANIDLYVVTVSSVDKPFSGEYEGIHFYILPGGSIFNYDVDAAQNKQYWQQIKDSVKPDVVVVWGTESRFTYLAMKVLRDTPKVIYVQGVMNAIITHLEDGVPHKVKMKTLRDFVDLFYHNKQSNRFIAQAEKEKEMFAMAQAAIVENDWCEAQCKALNKYIDIYINQLPIREEFYQTKWDYSQIEPYSLFTNAGGVPYKGHHILFQALAVVKKYYPQVKLYIPGGNYLQLYASLRSRTGYYKWLQALYDDNHLEENIVFTGVLNSQQMAERIAHCHVYAMPSMIENHSSSLIEAMIVGAPCVSSMVGGVASLVDNGRNAYMYNSGESSTLAGYILKLFASPEICQSFSMNALALRQKRHTDFGKEMSAIYQQCVSNFQK